MKVCAIMQPTYLPWMGYLDLIDQVDVFVFLDDVQFAKRSWQQRNRIKTPQGLTWLTVPAKVGGRSDQRIIDVDIADDPSFPRDHVRAIELNYRRTPNYAPLAESFAQALEAAASQRRLADLNIAMIGWLVEQYGFAGEMVRSSDLPTAGKRSARLLSVCHAVGAGTYLATPGSRAYIAEDRAQFDAAGVEVVIHGYEHPVYAQAFLPFQSHASAIDALFNLGPDAAAACLRSGRRPWTALSEQGGDPVSAQMPRPTQITLG